MLSSQKVIYLVIISMLIICNILGISVKGSNSYVAPSELMAYGLDDSSQNGVANIENSVMEDTNIADMTAELVDDSQGTTPVDPDNGFIIDDNTVTEPVPSDNTTATTPPDSTSTTTSVVTPTSSDNHQTVQTQPTEPAPTVRTTTTTTATTTRTTTRQTTTTTTYATISQAPISTTTTTYQTIAPTTRQTTRQTTATTNYTNKGTISFSLSAGGATVTEFRLYSGSSITLYLNSAFGETPIASYSSDNSSVAGVYSPGVGTVTVTGYSLGTTWIHAYNSNGSECHCKVTVTDFEDQVLFLCNQQRASQGIAPLELGPAQLKQVADLRLGEIDQVWSHTRPNGEKFSTAYPACGITYGKFGENLAKAQTTPEAVVDAWMKSPSHRANILNGQFKYCRISYRTSPRDGLMYWSQQFYTPYN